eukprot:scaffold479_cov123-Chaetoceros_neogracile.AAC.1
MMGDDDWVIPTTKTKNKAGKTPLEIASAPKKNKASTYNNNKVNMEVSMESKVREELLISLGEWGMSVGTRDGHVKFKRIAIEEALVNLHVKKKPFNYKIMRTENFPTDMNEAYEHILRQEDLPDDKIYAHIDTLEMEGFLNPFWRRYDRRLKFMTYERTPEYHDFTNASLDPLKRFQFRPTTKTDLLFKRWFVTEAGGNASDLGMVFETAIACHALQYESCYNCEGQNTLRWNGGSGASWQDLICVMCECMYEVKTKANMEKVSKSFDRNRISGGSFSSFWKLNNSKRPGQKMFLVILPRTSTLNRRKGQRGYPVHIAEIAHVLPQAYINTFNETMSKTSGMRFKSTISVKEGTQARWFDLPLFDWKKSTMRDIKERVFVDRFSRKRYAELDEQYFGNHKETIMEGLENLKIGDHETNTEGVEILNIVPDDWEDSLIITDSAKVKDIEMIARVETVEVEDGGGAHQGRSGGDDHQGGGGSGRYGDDRSGCGALGRRSAKERTDCRPCGTSVIISSGTGVIISKNDGMIHVESKDQKNSRIQREEARIEKKKRRNARKINIISGEQKCAEEATSKTVTGEAEAAAKAKKAAAKTKKATAKANTKKAAKKAAAKAKKVTEEAEAAALAKNVCLASNARIEKKKREEEEKRLAKQKCAEEAAAKKATEESEATATEKKAAAKA